jgi:arylformamidase
MTKLIDISVPLGKDLPLWPGSSGLRLTRLATIGKGGAHNETHLEINAHVGTHVDAPLHFVKGGATIGEAPLAVLVGEAMVTHLPKAKKITEEDLEKLLVPKGTKRILFKTANSALWKKGNKFNKEYVGLTTGAARWLAKRGVKLVGIDYLSIATMSEAKEVHQVLLGAGMHIIESLDLSRAKAGKAELVCLPLRLIGAEAAPARAFLIQ